MMPMFYIGFLCLSVQFKEMDSVKVAVGFLPVFLWENIFIIKKQFIIWHQKSILVQIRTVLI